MGETRSVVQVMRAVAPPSTNSGDSQVAGVGGTSKGWERVNQLRKTNLWLKFVENTIFL